MICAPKMRRISERSSRCSPASLPPDDIHGCVPPWPARFRCFRWWARGWWRQESTCRRPRRPRSSQSPRGPSPSRWGCGPPASPRRTSIRGRQVWQPDQGCAADRVGKRVEAHDGGGDSLRSDDLSAAGHRGENRDAGVVADLGLQPLQEPNVLVVEVHIDEPSRPSVRRAADPRCRGSSTPSRTQPRRSLCRKPSRPSGQRCTGAGWWELEPRWPSGAISNFGNARQGCKLVRQPTGSAGPHHRYLFLLDQTIDDAKGTHLRNGPWSDPVLRVEIRT